MTWSARYTSLSMTMFLQVGDADRLFLKGLQALEREARTRAEADVVLADHRREAAQGRLGVGHPCRVVGVLHVVGALQLGQLVGRKDTGLGRARVDVPGAGAMGAVEHDHLQPGPWVAAGCQLGGTDVGHHRQVHVQALALVIGGQGVDPGDALQGVHRGLQFLEAAGAVHGVPLLQHPVVAQVGVAQAEGVAAVPVELAGPLHHGAEL